MLRLFLVVLCILSDNLFSYPNYYNSTEKQLTNSYSFDFPIQGSVVFLDKKLLVYSDKQQNVQCLAKGKVLHIEYFKDLESYAIYVLDNDNSQYISVYVGVNDVQVKEGEHISANTKLGVAAYNNHHYFVGYVVINDKNENIINSFEYIKKISFA